MSDSSSEAESSGAETDAGEVASVKSESDSDSSSAADRKKTPAESADDFRRMLVQSMQSAGILTLDQLKKLVVDIGKASGCATGNVTLEFIERKFDDINKRIGLYNMNIRKVVCELTGQVFFMFYVTVECPVMRFQTSLEKYELELFKRITNQIMLDYVDFIAPCNDLIGLASEVGFESRTKTKVREILNKLVKLKYLIKVTDEDVGDIRCRITLGVRTIRELEPLLKDFHKDSVANCCLCKSLLLHGLQCGKCKVAFHRHCFKTFTETTRQCPNPICKAALPTLELMPKRVRIIIINEEPDEAVEDSDIGSEISDMDTSSN